MVKWLMWSLLVKSLYRGQNGKVANVVSLPAAEPFILKSEVVYLQRMLLGLGKRCGLIKQVPLPVLRR